MEKQLIGRKTCTSSTTSDTNLTLCSLGQKLGHHDIRLVTIQLIMYNLLLHNNLLSFFQEQSTSVWCGFLLTFIIKEFSSETTCLETKANDITSKHLLWGPVTMCTTKWTNFTQSAFTNATCLSCKNNWRHPPDYQMTYWHKTAAVRGQPSCLTQWS